MEWVEVNHYLEYPLPAVILTFRTVEVRGRPFGAHRRSCASEVAARWESHVAEQKTVVGKEKRQQQQQQEQQQQQQQH